MRLAGARRLRTRRLLHPSFRVIRPDCREVEPTARGLAGEPSRSERPGKAVSRQALLEQVWGYDYEGGSNVVDSSVRTLRKKLGDRASLIETVRGVGYSYRAA